MATPAWMKSAGRSFGIGMASARRCLPEWVQRGWLGLPTGWAPFTPDLCDARGWEVRRLPTDDLPRRVEAATLGDEAREIRDASHEMPDRSAPFVAIIPGGEVLGRTGSCVTPDGQLLLDVSPHLGLLRPDHHRAFTGYAFMPPARQIRGQVAVIAASSAGNYFHWMLDSLPRLGTIEAAGFQLQELDGIVVPDSSMAAMASTLRLLGIPESRLVRMGHLSRIRADRLIVPSLPGPSGAPRSSSIRFLRERMAPVAGHGIGGAARLFVERGSRRVVTNAEQVRNAVSRHGFVPVRMEGLSFEQQVRLFSTADAVIGIHGAALTNLAFCRPGTRVLELFAPTYVNPCYAILSARAGHRYRYLVGMRERRPKAGRWANIQLDIARLEDEIGAMLAGG